METIEDMLIYVDHIDELLGNPLWEIIKRITEGNPEHPLLQAGHKYGVCNTLGRGLTLANDDDYFLIKNDGVWELVTELNRTIAIGPERSVTNALYVEARGLYAHAVGRFSTQRQILERKEIPPL